MNEDSNEELKPLKSEQFIKSPSPIRNPHLGTSAAPQIRGPSSKKKKGSADDISSQIDVSITPWDEPNDEIQKKSSTHSLSKTDRVSISILGADLTPSGRRRSFAQAMENTFMKPKSPKPLSTTTTSKTPAATTTSKPPTATTTSKPSSPTAASPTPPRVRRDGKTRPISMNSSSSEFKATTPADIPSIIQPLFTITNLEETDTQDTVVDLEKRQQRGRGSFMGSDVASFGLPLNVSMSHQVLIAGEDAFKELADTPLISEDTFSNNAATGGSMRYMKTRTGGLFLVHCWHDNGVCHKLIVSPNTTLHEIRMEVLSAYGFIPNLQDFKIILKENGGKESKQDPNNALDKYLSKEDTQTEIPEFFLKKQPPMWNMTVEVNSEKKRRFIIVGWQTKTKEALDLLCSIEGLDETQRETMGLYREGKNNSRFLEENETPFEIDVSSRFFLIACNDESKRAIKLTNIFGVPKTNFNDVILKGVNAAEDSKRMNDALKSQKLTHWFGFNEEEKKKPSTSGARPTYWSTDQTKSTVLRNRSKNLDENGEIVNVVSTMEMILSTNSDQRIGYEEKTECVTSCDSLQIQNADEKERKTSKLMNYFGVKPGEKEMTMLSNLSRDKFPKKLKDRLKTNENTFLARIYFGNLTYTSVSLPMNGTADLAMTNLFSKFKINDKLELYGIHEYYPNTGEEIEIDKDQQLFKVMIKWEQNEMFLFKRKTQKRLRAKEQSQFQSEDHHKKGTYEVLNALDASTNRRQQKLTNFFGVHDKKENKHSIKKRKWRKEFDDLKALLDEIKSPHVVIDVSPESVDEKELTVNSFRASKDSTKESFQAVDNQIIKEVVNIDSISKEGWLLTDFNGTWVTSWISINTATLSLRNTNSEKETKNESISLENCSHSSRREISDKNLLFFVQDYKGKKITFNASSLQDAEDWIKAIQLSKLKIRRKTIISMGLIEGSGSYISSQNLGNAPTSKENEALEEVDETDDVIESGKEANSLMLLSDFEFHKVVGRGKYAKVLLCSQKKTGKVYAMKVVQKNDSDGVGESSMNESKILHAIAHPFIVRLICAFESKQRLYMVMEYLNAGELFFHICNFGRFSEDRVKFYCAEVLLAIECLHGKGIIYRDLKLENILLSKDGHIKVTDFGLSKMEDEIEPESNHIVGTLEYLAPEVLRGQPASYASDWWAFGVIFFEMICGFHPFYSDERQYIHEFILSAPIEFPDHVSNAAEGLGIKLLIRNPANRLGSGGQGGLEIRQEPFFKSIDFVKLFNKQLPVPFLPELVDDFDVRFFDEQFTEEPITPVESLESLENVQFMG